MKKRFLSLLLCMVLALGLLPTAAFAAEGDTAVKAIQLGTGGISDPAKVTVDGKGDYYTPNSYIYFGVNSGDNNTPIKWRVLDADTANDGKTSGMFLLSEYLLASGVYFNSDYTNNNAYQGSDAQRWCSNFADNNFSTMEQGAMLGVTKTDSAGNNLYYIKWGVSSLTADDKLFFLSVRELADYVGNYKAAPGMLATDTAQSAGAWWLRSPLEYDFYAGTVDCDGFVNDVGVFLVCAARPAFNLNLNSVLFTSAAEGGKSVSGMGSGLTAVKDYDGNEWKLTLKDSNRAFSVAVSTKENATVKSGDTVKLNYSGATVGTNEYISVILADSNNSITHYGRVLQPTSASGTVDITVPSGLSDGTYSLHVFSEQYNGGEQDNTKLTDYASAFQTVTLTVDNTAPTLSSVSATRDSVTNATVKFTSDEAGTYHYAVVEQGATTPSIDTTAAGMACTNGENTISLTTLSGLGAKDIYIVAKDATGNVSDQLKITIPATIYSIAADPVTLDFGSAAYGYAAPEAKTVTIANTGNQQITLNQPTAGTIGNYMIGELSKTGLAAGETATFTVQPKAGLAVGNYDETLTVSGSDGVSAQVQLLFTVNKAEQTAPAKPELDSRTKSSITLKAISDNDNGAKAQYRMNDGEWQDSPVFTGLSSGTEYSFTARYAEMDSYAASPASVAATFRTDSSGGGGGVSAYAVTVKDSKNGTVTADRRTASYGTTVTLTVSPDQGWTLETLTVADRNGKKIDLAIVTVGEKYTFQMPSSKVTVEATFMEDNTMLNYFVDVSASDYYYDAVLWAAVNGITSGVDALHFAPDAPCTRGQIVTFLWRAAGSPEPQTMSGFADVAADSYCAKAVAWAVERGITSGTGNGRFSPDEACTRAQAVTFLYRAAGSPAVSGYAEFDDVMTDAYYARAVAWATEQGVTEGVGSRRFAPDDTCTRGQIVTFLWRSQAD